MLKAFRYKLNPNKKQRQLLSQTLDTCRELYNMGLEQRRGQHVGVYEQKRQLTLLKGEFPEYKNVHCHVLQNVLFKLDQSFQNFFRRCKTGGKFGFPRFKGKDRYDSFQFNNTGFSLDGSQLSISKVGNVKVRLSRELPEGAIVKTCTVKQQNGSWFATLTFEYTPVPLPTSDIAVGIDVGVTTFATFSDGTEIQNPRFYQNAQAELRRAQRKVARRTKGSNRRRRAVVLLRKLHEHISNQRTDFLHKHSTAVIRKYGTIVVEALNVSGMSRGNLSKQILDCSWSEWFRQLSYKAVEAGRTFVAVDPRYTSQTCSECGFVSRDNRKTQAFFRCVSCGHSDNADHNGAVNILGRMCPLGVKIGEPIPCLA
jgi:putative transposase